MFPMRLADVARLLIFFGGGIYKRKCARVFPGMQSGWEPVNRHDVREK